MSQNRISNSTLQILKSFYTKNLLLLLAFLALDAFLFSVANSDIKYELNILNANIQNSIRRNLAIIENDLYIRAQKINSGLYSEVAAINDNSLSDFYNAIYIVDKGANLLHKRKFSGNGELANFDLPWLDELDKKPFVVSKRIYKGGKLDMLYAAYRLDDGKKIIVDLNLKFLLISVDNVLSKRNYVAFLADRNGNLLTDDVNKKFKRSDYIKYLSRGDEFGESKTIFSPLSMSLNVIGHMKDYKIFVIVGSTKNTEILIRCLLIFISFLSFIGFVMLWIRDAIFTKKSILIPLQGILESINDREKKITGELAIKDIEAINNGINELYGKIDEANSTLESYKGRFGYVFEQSLLNIIIYDTYTGEVIDVSNNLLKISGYTREEILNANINDFTYSNFSDIVYRRREAIENSKPLNLKVSLKNGEMRNISVIESPIQLKGRRLNFVIIKDITGETKVDTNNEIIKNYMFISPNVIMLAEQAEPFIATQSTNNANLIFNINDDAPIDIRSLICNENINEFVNAIEVAKKLFIAGNGTKEALKLIVKMTKRDGKNIPFKIYVKFMLNEENQLDKVVYSFSDLSDFAQLQERYDADKEHFKNILWASQAAVFSWNKDGKTLQVSDEFAKMLGFDSANELGIIDFKRFKDLCVGEYENFERLFDTLKDGDSSYYGELKFYAKDKSIVHVTLKARAFELDDNNQVRIVKGVLKNTMPQISAFAREELFGKFFYHTKDGAAILGENFEIIDINDAFCEMSGYLRDEILNKDVTFVKQGLSGLRNDMRIACKDGFWQSKIWNKNKNGENKFELINLSRINDSKNGFYCYIMLVSNINESGLNKDYLEYIAYHDPLTGLPNRILFSRKLDRAICKFKNDKHIAIAYLDMDGFKNINDTYGHKLGDKFLMEISSRIDKLFDERDMFARVGGDEFVAIVVYENENEVYETVQNMLAIASSEVEYEDVKLKISASIGISMSVAGEVSGENLLEQADWAMYQAKLKGKNRYYVFDASKDRNLKNQYEDGSKVLKALQNNELFLEYQPEIDVKTGKILSYEALIRWQNGDRIIYPDDFLPLVKRQYIIDDIALFSIKNALKAQILWRKNGVDAKACVNLHIERLCSDEFFSKFKELASENSQLNFNELIVDIVDANSANDLNEAQNALQRYKRFGVRFMLDDFASYSSSFEALGLLKVERFKVDKQLSRHIFDSKASVMILRTIKHISDVFGLKATIKNIEDKKTLEILSGFGFEHFQGNLFTKPLKLDEVLKYEFHGISGLNFKNYIDDEEFKSLRDCVGLKECALDIVSYLQNNENLSEDIKDELYKKIQNNDLYEKIRAKLTEALHTTKSRSLALANEADEMCNEILNLART
ncbi:MAG: EAL domain-containing protein [Campylobacter sp.]|nr:EAL domain-containing protein [Campylobacter sp.]